MKRSTRALPALLSMSLMFFLGTGTCKQGTAQTSVGKEQPAAMSEKKCPTPEEETFSARKHVVKRGECLWWIAEYEDIYNDSFMWPLIYTANRDRVKDPDRIYPDQILRIPRNGYTIDEVREARRQAGALPPYTPPGDSLPPLDEAHPSIQR